MRPHYYQTTGFQFKSGDMALVCPVHPVNFYVNLITGNWKGRRAQKKPIELDLTKVDTKIVPYYEFDYKQNHIMLYPAKVQGTLDLPAMVRGNMQFVAPEILGAGYFHISEHDSLSSKQEETALYWKFDDRQSKLATKSLIERLGRIKRG